VFTYASFERDSSAKFIAVAIGFEAIPSVIGPMGRSVRDLELACRVTFGKGGRDRSVAPIPYRDIQLPAKMKFGYYTSDNFAKASPACKRAVLETVNALEKLGHECVEFEIPSRASLVLFVTCFLVAFKMRPSSSYSSSRNLREVVFG
jgi:Asp-tRNA(Asn)/Glu-tRNA(Gln) amidotransferase A subunit family amidase